MSLLWERTKTRSSAEQNVRMLLSHQLHLDILRAHLRLSVQDLLDPVTIQRHEMIVYISRYIINDQASVFAADSTASFLAPIMLVQDTMSTLFRIWSLFGVLRSKGRNVTGLVALTAFNTLFGRFYSRFLPRHRRHAEHERRREKFLRLATSIATRAEVCTFGLKTWILETYDKCCRRSLEEATSTETDYHIQSTLRTLVSSSTFALSHILVATQYSHAMTLSSLSLLQNATGGIIRDLLEVYSRGKRLFWELQQIRMYYDFLDPKITSSSLSRMEPYEAYSEPTGRGMRIEMDSITFAYPNSPTRPVLKGLSFVLEAGDFVAVVGGNGSGKSTLVKLLTRMYDVTEGCVKINDIDIRRYDMDELWSHMSLINQEYGMSLVLLMSYKKVVTIYLSGRISESAT